MDHNDYRYFEEKIANLNALLDRYRAFVREWDVVDEANTLVCYQREPTRQSWGIHGKRWGGLLDGVRNARATIADIELEDE